MIRLNPIPLTQLKSLIELAFKDDAALLTSIHIAAPASLDKCVEETFRNLSDHEQNYGIDCYEVVEEEEGLAAPIGFVATIIQPEIDVDILISFGINITYRKPELLEEWLVAVKKLFGGRSYQVSLWNRNQRAIRFFQKHGFNNLQQEDNFVIVWQS